MSLEERKEPAFNKKGSRLQFFQCGCPTLLNFSLLYMFYFIFLIIFRL